MKRLRAAVCAGRRERVDRLRVELASRVDSTDFDSLKSANLNTFLEAPLRNERQQF